MRSGGSCDPSSEAPHARATAQTHPRLRDRSRGFGAELLDCIVAYVSDPLDHHVAKFAGTSEMSGVRRSRL
jgi:hypothetical protein